jgi:mannosyltransferase
VEVVGRKITNYGIALLAIVLVGVFLRVYHLGTTSIWGDEAVSIWFGRLNVSQMVQATAGDVHPPLYYFLLHYWMMFFGTSEVAVRLLSVLFGVLAIPMIYVVGRQLFDEEVGLVGALILALSSFNIAYSQETRMYTLMVLLTLLSMYFFLRLLQRSNPVLLAGYVLSTTLLAYTHIYGLFVVIAQNIYVVSLLLLSKHCTFRLKHWAVLQAIVVALFAPWIGVLMRQAAAIESGYWIPRPTINTIVETFHSYSNYAGDSAGSFTPLYIFIGFSIFSLLTYKKVRGSLDWKAPQQTLKSFLWEVRIQDAVPVYLLAVWLLTINLIPFVISLFATPIYLLRYTIAASAAFYLLVAKGIRNINNRYAKVAVIVLIALLCSTSLQTYYGSWQVQPREAINVVNNNAKSGDLVIYSPTVDVYTWRYYNKTNSVNFTFFPDYKNDTDPVVKEFQEKISTYDRVWFILRPGGNADKFALKFFNESYTTSDLKNYHGYRVYLFEKRT